MPARQARSGESLPREFLSKKSDFREPAAADYADTPRATRARPTVMDPGKRKKVFAEIESTLSAQAAQAEAARCLECGCQDVKDCALKLHATEYDAVAKRYLGEVATHPIDESHPYISRDPSKCVLCGRCIRICLEVQGIGVFGYMYRGFASVVAPSFGSKFGEDTTCISCGQCVSACPVGALTEKLPARKTVPLQEKAVEATCMRCSVGCGIECRWHGSLFTRITERYEALNNGKLCKKGKFGHEFLNEPLPDPVDLAAARTKVQALLHAARTPLMRISPYLCGEAIDAFLEAAKRADIPVQTASLERVNPRWLPLAAAHAAGCVEGKPLVVLVGDIAASNNVTFTEAYRRQRAGAAELWVAGHDDEVARRTATRVESDFAVALRDAAALGCPVEVLVNPQEAGIEVLESILAVREKAAVNLLWNARNAGYLFTRQSPSTNKPDLLLDVSVEESTNGTKRILWGQKPAGKALFIPLPREALIFGTSHPTAMPSVSAGTVPMEELKAAAAVI